MATCSGKVADLAGFATLTLAASSICRRPCGAGPVLTCSLRQGPAPATTSRSRLVGKASFAMDRSSIKRVGHDGERSCSIQSGVVGINRAQSGAQIAEELYESGRKVYLATGD